MKKLAVILLASLTIFALTGCGSGKDSDASKEGEASKYSDALEVMNAVLEVYTDDQRFAIAGGDSSNMTEDAPGKFDVSKTEELDYMLGLPADQAAVIDDAASMVHMMNANTFTGAVYHLTEGTDVTAFADAVKANILARQWMCGFPDKLLIIDVDGRYVITAFGEAGIMEIFKTNALSALSDAQVITEDPIL
ncbi:MAG: hypothetical protein HFG25_07325 [Lachnospiraceae bacterium]|jgi:hypothetical protein|nr:hypothetical protein [Lachnospiraceae bacterium]